MGIGHWALGIGHWALGIGHWALEPYFLAVAHYREQQHNFEVLPRRERTGISVIQPDDIVDSNSASKQVCLRAPSLTDNALPVLFTIQQINTAPQGRGFKPINSGKINWVHAAAESTVRCII